MRPTSMEGVEYSCEAFSCYCGVTPANTVIPDATGLIVPGQFNIPGGIASNGTVNVSDGSGINAIYQDPAVNPNPTGGWMPLAQALVNAAQKSYTSFEKGSPAPATPVAQRASATTSGGPGFTLNSKGFDVQLPFSGQTLLLLGLGALALIVIARA